MVDVEHHWTHKLVRENDLFLMDEFMKYNFTPAQMKLINQCRLYLQVITIADITAADGKRLLRSTFNGIQPQDRISTLYWPRQEPLPENAWNLWRTALSYLTTQLKLHNPLSSWLRNPHQQWNWYKGDNTNGVYFRTADGTWFLYEPVTPPVPSNRVTRQTKL